MHPAVERAGLLIELKRYDEARDVLVQRLADDPEDIRAWTRLASAHLGERPNGPKALEATERALALDPEDTGALTMHAHALRHSGRFPETEGVLREVIRLAPDHWHGYALLADWVWRLRVWASQPNGGQLEREVLLTALREADLIAQEAIRLGPEEVYAYEVARLIADMGGDTAAAARLDETILRLDPHNEIALTRHTKRQATAPGVKAAQAAALYADALATTPGSATMRQGLDHASYRLLRGIRWLALLCLALAATGIDLFPTEDEVQRELPLALGQRLWDLVPMAAIWALGALLRYRRLRAGVRVNLHSLIRRRAWPRVVLAQAAWAMLMALLITQIPWTDRAAPTALFWAGLVPTAATLWFDRRKVS
nr:tetratricopeptide repeat protein [Streptomyces sp. SID9727]